jgi:hypothetical protein
MMTASIDVVLSKPGIYIVLALTHVAAVEVLPEGAVYQLDPDTLARDGLLDRGGWNLPVIQKFLGPFARVGGAG